MAKLFLADRQPLFNDALDAVLTRDGRHEVVGRSSSRRSIVASVRQRGPDLLLIDADLALNAESNLLQQMLTDQPAMKVLVLSGEISVNLIARAMRAGAVGVVLKTSRADTVVGAVHAALSNEGFVPQPILIDSLRRLDEARCRAADSPMNRLSLRERQVLLLLGQGMSNESIGIRLSISRHTARTHVQNILEKLQIHSRLEAATFAMERAGELSGVG